VEHLDRFGLDRDPFSNEPQLASWFESPGHAAAEQRLLRALRQGKGLCVLLGEGGSGKTLLVRHLLESLEEELFEACMLVPVPGVSDGRWILDRFARQLGVEEPAGESAALLGQIYDRLAIVREDGRHTVLVLDEAQVLAEQGVLRELRGLLNLEYEDRRLLTLVLVGLPSLGGALTQDRGLADRVEVRVVLPAFDAKGAGQYLAHRLRAAGGHPAILETAAVDALVKVSAGNPRRLNTLADNALFEAHLAGRDRVTPEDVERAARELGLGETPTEPAPAERAAPPRPPREVPVRARGGAEPARPAALRAAPGRMRPGPDAELTTFFPRQDEEIDEVFAAETNPPVAVPEEHEVRAEPRRRRRPEAAETVALFDDVKAEGEGELDDLFADLVED
jgi:type II secretory pathway predicted ATPase ExeA